MEEIKTKIQNTVQELYNLEVVPEVTVAPAETGADFASNVALKLAREIHRNPREIATEIAEKIDLRTEVAGAGFLNFILPDDYFLTKIAGFATNFQENISQDEYLDKTVICEFSDPNPFKVLHVGHLYTSIIGDGIARLFETAGAKVVRANFGGDVGLHVAKTIYAIKKTDSKKALDKLGIDDIAKCYVAGTQAYEADETAHAEITKLNKEIYEISRNQITEGEVAKIYWRGRELSYDYFNDFYAKIGVKFDKYYPESTVVERGLTEVKTGLERGVYELSDGAVIYRGEKVGLHTRVFINKNGLPTYEAKDVGLINTKWDDYHFDRSIVITGNEIVEYMKVVLASVKEMHPELVERTRHLTHGNVKLSGGVKMSSRKGNFLKAIDVLNLIAETLTKKPNFDDLTENEQKIALAAIKFAFLKVKIGGEVIFDPKESVSLTGCSGPYLQYSCVRAQKILDKIQTATPNEKYKLNQWEKKLAQKLANYPEVLKQAVGEMASHKICNYLYELAQEFSRFYENVKVAGSEFEFERGQLVSAYLNILSHGLNLLGIEVPDEM